MRQPAEPASLTRERDVRMKLNEKLLGSLVVSGAWLLGSPSQALAACPGGSDGPSVNVSRTFASGARWSFDVQVTPCEGLMLSNVRYQPAFNPERQVFARAALAEV